MANRIQLRRGTAAEWAAANPVLAQGEPGIEKDTGKAKYGDGVTAWAGLSYAAKGDKGDDGIADDASVAAAIESPLTSAALSAAFGPRRNLMSYFTPGWYAAHGGGDALYPVNSMEGYRASAAAGFALETDIQVLADGTQVIWHGYAPETLLGPGITSLSQVPDLPAWRRLSIAPVIPGGRRGTPVTLDDLLDEFGGKVPLLLEIKHGNAPAAVRMYDNLKARGLQDSVIVMGFTYWQPETWTKQYGGHGLYLNSNGGPGTTGWKTPAELVASGIEYVGFDQSVIATHGGAFDAAGVKVTGYTYISRAAVMAQPSFVQGFTCADPWQCSGRPTLAQVSNFGTGYLWPTATIAGAPDTKATVNLDPLTPGVAFKYLAADTTQKGVRLGQFGEGPTKSTIRFGLQFTPGASADDRIAILFIGKMHNNEPFMGHSDTTIEGYFFNIRRNGNLEIQSRVAGSPTQVLVAAKTTGVTPYAVAAATGPRSEFEIAITDTDITLTDLGSGVTVTGANASYRGNEAVLSLATLNSSAIFSNIRINR